MGENQYIGGSEIIKEDEITQVTCEGLRTETPGALGMGRGWEAAARVVGENKGNGILQKSRTISRKKKKD